MKCSSEEAGPHLSSVTELQEMVPMLLFFFLLFPPLSFQVYSSSPSPLAPALFVIGDSTVDCGTNNHLLTLARADRLPYGRDFDTRRPTGRFSNGRVVVDYLGEFVGLSFFPFSFIFGKCVWKICKPFVLQRFVWSCHSFGLILNWVGRWRNWCVVSITPQLVLEFSLLVGLIW